VCVWVAYIKCDYTTQTTQLIQYSYLPILIREGQVWQKQKQDQQVKTDYGKCSKVSDHRKAQEEHD